jgi:hypothetical protein
MEGSRKNTLARIRYRVSRLLAGELVNDVIEIQVKVDER